MMGSERHQRPEMGDKNGGQQKIYPSYLIDKHPRSKHLRFPHHPHVLAECLCSQWGKLWNLIMLQTGLIDRLKRCI